MSHILVIKDSSGKELARVPVTSGYTIQEVSASKEKTKDSSKATSVDVDDSGKGKGRVGSN